MGCKCHEHHDDFDTSMNCVCEVVRAIRDIQDAREEEDCKDCKDCFAEPLGDLDGMRRRDADTRVFTLTTKKGKPFFAFFQADDMMMMMKGDGHGKDQEKGQQKQGGDAGCVSIFFRVEDVFDNCCARLRVLQPMQNENKPIDIGGECGVDLEKVCKVQHFRKTRSCITVDLKAFIAIQCIKDVDLDICR